MQNRKLILDERMEQFRQATKAAGIKLTPQRLEIFKIVAQSITHPGADEIYRQIHQQMPSVSLDTVYRTLWMLADLGLISTVGQRQEGIRFDANPQKHHHFTCVKCGLIRDFINQELDALPIPPQTSDYGTSISLQIEVKGICAECMNKNQEKLSQSRKKGEENA